MNKSNIPPALTTEMLEMNHNIQFPQFPLGVDYMPRYPCIIEPIKRWDQIKESRYREEIESSKDYKKK